MSQQKNRKSIEQLNPNFAARAARLKKSSDKTGAATHRGNKNTACYEIEPGNRYVRRFKLLFRDGRLMSLPYAHLPVFVFDPSGLITIETSETIISIRGRGLKVLCDWFNEEKVLWVRENPSGIDDDKQEVFIKTISVELGS